MRANGKSPDCVHVICDGSSLTHEQAYLEASQIYPAQMEVLLRASAPLPVKVWEVGLGSQTFADLIARFPTYAAPHLPQIGRPVIAILSEALNTLWNAGNGGVTAAMAIAQHQQWAALYRERGAKIVVWDAIANGALASVPAIEAERVAYNDLLRAEWATWADAFEPLSAIFTDSTDATLYQGDGAHWTAAGAAIAASRLAPHVARLGWGA